jgi:hypothetical protein
VIRELSSQEMLRLADALPEDVETMTGIHRLRRGIARAWIAGTPEEPVAAVVQSRFLIEEPALYGGDPDAGWAVLQAVPGWLAVNAERSVAPELAALIEAETGQACSLRDEYYYTLERSVAPFRDPAVRLLGLGDLAMVEAATEALAMHGWRFGSAEALLSDGLLAGAVVDGELVAVAFSAAATPRYIEVGIKTHEAWRGRGCSTAAASIVCAEIQRAGKIPVWSTEEDNIASQRVGAKLGFREVSRRVYVNLPAE